MTELDYAIQRMRDALDNLVLSDDLSDAEEALDDLNGGLADAYAALGIDNPND